MKLKPKVPRTDKQRLASRHNYAIYKMLGLKNNLYNLRCQTTSLSLKSIAIMLEIDAKFEELHKSMKRRSDMI